MAGQYNPGPVGKRSRRERLSFQRAGGPARPAPTSRARLLWLVLAVLAVGAAVGLLARYRPGGGDASGGFKEVGRNGPVFTASVPRARVDDEEYLMKSAEQISAREAASGASGQISVMVWPDTVTVPKEPPTTEFDASMKTQAAGIFINPKMNIKHLIRFRDGQTVSERDFGRKIQ